MSSPSPSKKRMDNDVIKLVRNYPVTLVDGFNQFIVRFTGPSETPYEGGVWNVRVELPEAYPFKSPSIGFMNKIFHPNIDEASGTVCLDVINQTWTALYELSNVFDVFLPQLLKYPNADDPLNSAAATMYMHHPDEYASKVKEYVQRFACEKVINGKENGKVKDDGNECQSDESSMSDFEDDEAQDMDI